MTKPILTLLEFLELVKVEKMLNGRESANLLYQKNIADYITFTSSASANLTDKEQSNG